MFREQICLLEELILCHLQLDFFYFFKVYRYNLPREKGRVGVWYTPKSLVPASEWPLFAEEAGVYGLGTGYIWDVYGVCC